ncbi:MAG: ATP-binding cassette domain-containing protein [Anaerocolumna sp.]
MVVEIKNLVKRYDRLVALDHLEFEIEKGEIFGILGPSGSGKTSLINCILSLSKPDKGSVLIFGKEMSLSANNIKKELGVIMQYPAVFHELTLEENIIYFCSLYINSKNEVKRLTKEVMEFLGLENFAGFYPSKLSAGLLSRLNIACGIVHKPALVFIDEPTHSVDPQSRNKILECIKVLNQSGVTILYSSHNMEEMESLCHRIAMINKGKLVACGSIDELKDMISLGEKITVEVFMLSELQLEDIKKIPNVSSAAYEDNKLRISSKKGKNNLIYILDYLQKNDIQFGKIYTEMPTLNDVFLEITGKGLQD